MKRTRILSFILTLSVCLCPSAFPQGEVAGFKHAYLFLCDTPGFCVKEVHPKVVRFRVEGRDPGFQSVIWDGLPRVGDFIDTLGANKVEVQAFYSFAPGEHELVGFGVIVETAEWPGGSSGLRTTCTIRTNNPNWDFTLLGRNFCEGGQPAAASGYRVRPGAVAASRAKQLSGDGTTPSDAKSKPKPGSESAKAAKPKSDTDSLLGVHWPSGDDKQQSTATPAPNAVSSRAPRSESEARQAIENMGFKIVGPATFGTLQGYRILIADAAKAAQFGFREIKLARAADGKQAITSWISCWTERSGDHLIIWIDQREVSIPNDSKLPPYVKLFSR
jgi:hypothetical protein